MLGQHAKWSKVYVYVELFYLLSDWTRTVSNNSSHCFNDFPNLQSFIIQVLAVVFNRLKAGNPQISVEVRIINYFVYYELLTASCPYQSFASDTGRNKKLLCRIEITLRVTPAEIGRSSKCCSLSFLNIVFANDDDQKRDTKL